MNLLQLYAGRAIIEKRRCIKDKVSMKGERQ